MIDPQKQLRNPVLSGCRFYSLTVIVILVVILSACNPINSRSHPTISPTHSEASVPVVSPMAAPALAMPAATATTTVYTLWIPGYLPEKLRSSIIFPGNITLVDAPDSANFTVQVSDKVNQASSVWVYALVAPFPTVTDGISSTELRSAWAGGAIPEFDAAPLLIDESTLAIMSAFWGAPAAQAIHVVPPDQLLEYAWANQPSWAIVPFEALQPRWKVLAVDGQSPIHKDFDPSAYPLSIPIVLKGNAGQVSNQIILPATNRDSSKLTTVAMTGVTAMVRATAYAMELKGITYPAQDVGPLLASADITHISNEIPFWPDCPPPTPTMDDLVFCSSPSYIDLLKAVGTDIVELTGDHFMDHGTAATLYTLQMYKDLGWPYYGGGAHPQAARQPLKLENNGNKIAFMGCNVGCEVKPSIPCDAIATDEHPGAAQCDYNWIAQEIPALKNEGYQVIFTFQHNEYYTYTTEPDLVQDFGRVALDGAAIVSGSQAHQAHGFSFQDGAFIHYGLGNLFFDQYHYCYRDECDQAFIDRHVFYDGSYISTELITIRFVDYARPRLMTSEERAQFLRMIFSYSRW